MQFKFHSVFFRPSLILMPFCGILVWTLSGKPVALAQNNATEGGLRATIRGRVLDNVSGMPLQDVNVFLANTTMGSATNANGEFVIPGIPVGSFDLVATRLGYRTETRHLIVEKEQVLEVRMIPRPYRAPEIEVTAAATRKWHKDFLRFRRLFFSDTENARECKILNPEVLDFHHRKNGIFSVSATEPLQIENKALGYRIYYVLEIFTVTRRVITQRGFSRYEEMLPQTQAKKHKWRKKRRQAYRGSLKHFLAALAKAAPAAAFPRANKQETLTREGFRVFSISDPWYRRGKKPLREPNQILQPLKNGKEHLLTFPEYLMVDYFKEEAPEKYYNFGEKFGYPRQQISLIKLVSDSVRIDTLGNVCDDHGMRVDGFGIRTYGYWSWERMADRLPWDYHYSPEESESRIEHSQAVQ